MKYDKIVNINREYTTDLTKFESHVQKNYPNVVEYSAGSPLSDNSLVSLGDFLHKDPHVYTPSYSANEWSQEVFSGLAALGYNHIPEAFHSSLESILLILSNDTTLPEPDQAKIDQPGGRGAHRFSLYYIDAKIVIHIYPEQQYITLKKTGDITGLNVDYKSSAPVYVGKEIYDYWRSHAE